MKIANLLNSGKYYPTLSNKKYSIWPLSGNYFYYFIILSFAIIAMSCEQEKDPMIITFDQLYGHILDGNYNEIEPMLSEESLIFLNKVTDDKYLNVDSIVALGTEYRLPYTLVQFLAFHGYIIENGNARDEFYRYLGTQDVSIFSFRNGYYVDKSKLKKGKENYVALVKEEMSASKRGWVKYNGNEETGYKLDLLYTLQLHEINNKKKNQTLRNQYQDIKTKDEFLKTYYWMNEGKNSVEFESKQLQLEEGMRDGRSQTIQSYKDRGLMGE